MPDPCQLIGNEVNNLTTQIHDLQIELQDAAGSMKAAITAQIHDAQAQLRAKTTELENCRSHYVAPNTYKCNDGGVYYFTEAGTNFYWFGEHQNNGFANIFIGTRNGNVITGNWYDVPKGRTNHRGSLTLLYNEEHKSFSRIQVTGGFGGSLWEPYNPYKDSQRAASKLFKTPGYQSKTTRTGAWMGSDKTNFYLNQIDDFVVAFAEGANFSGIFWGPYNGETWNCNWATVARSGADLQTGTTGFDLYQNPLLSFVKYLQHTGHVSGLSDTRISKTDAIDCSINLTTFQIPDQQETFNDEPFLWTCLLKLDGDTVAFEDIASATPYIWCRGEHGDVQPGAISPYLGKFSITFKTARDLDPYADPVRDLTKLAIIVLAFEQDQTSDDAILAGRRAFESTLSDILQDAIRNADISFDLGNHEQVLRDAITNAIIDAQRSIYGFIDPDDFIGFQYKVYSFADFSPLSDPGIDFNFYSCTEFINQWGQVTRDPNCPVPGNAQMSSVVDAHYRVTGNIQINYVPALVSEIPSPTPVHVLENTI